MNLLKLIHLNRHDITHLGLSVIVRQDLKIQGKHQTLDSLTS